MITIHAVVKDSLCLIAMSPFHSSGNINVNYTYTLLSWYLNSLSLSLCVCGGGLVRGWWVGWVESRYIWG
jgi:hypothetical protein